MNVADNETKKIEKKVNDEPDSTPSAPPPPKAKRPKSTPDQPFVQKPMLERWADDM